MALDFLKLRSFAHCDEAKTKLEAELDRYQVRDVNIDYGIRVDDRTADSVAKRLADATAEITSATAVLAIPNLSKRRREQAEADLMRATYQKESLEARTGGAEGVDSFLAEVNADQNSAQVDVLTAALAGVASRRAELTA